MSVVDVIASALVLLGVTFTLLGAIGLQRFPDVFARMHAVSKPVTLGLGLTLLGAALHLDAPGAKVKLLLVVVLQLTTAPLSSHMIGRAAYRAGTELSPDTTIDEVTAAELEHG
ncbi:MAG TPA: monovalent cation/H(+) antiporter subunit G [Egibacteraceae bacterium]